MPKETTIDKIKTGIETLIWLGAATVVTYGFARFMSSLFHPPKPYISPSIEEIYDVESHNPNLSPYDMTNVNVLIDSNMVSRDSWTIWWITFFNSVPIIWSGGQDIIYLENGGHISVNSEAYRRAQIGDRIIRWEYTTDGDLSPQKYDIWRNDILIYRRLSILDSVAPQQTGNNASNNTKK